MSGEPCLIGKTRPGENSGMANEKGEAIDSEAFANDWRGQMFKIHTQVNKETCPQ